MLQAGKKIRKQEVFVFRAEKKIWKQEVFVFRTGKKTRRQETFENETETDGQVKKQDGQEEDGREKKRER